MEHMLIYTLVGGIVAAFVFGVVAVNLRLPAISGYLLAGVLLGPYTPGFVADASIAKQFAEVGIILLMFGVGLHFSFKDLRRVHRIAIPGAVVQMCSATLIGGGAASLFGYGLMEGLVFGFALSVASTIVLIRALEQFSLLDSAGGKIAVGWLVVEDIAMVVALVLLPVLAGFIHSTGVVDVGQVLNVFLEVVLKIGGFVLFMVVVGRNLIPWMVKRILRLKYPELETLCTLAIALGFAALAYVAFGASFALGAFLAGMMLNTSEPGQDVVERTLPMRDAFSVLFFVSVGMLFDPATLLDRPLAVLLTFLIIVVVKSVSALAILSFFKQPAGVMTTVALGLSQIGEFSFIFGGLALANGLIGQDLYNLILAGALLSIVANPFLFRWSRSLGVAP